MYNEIVRLMVHLHVVLTISCGGESVRIFSYVDCYTRAPTRFLHCARRQADSPRPQSVALFFLYLLVNTNEGARRAF